MFIDIHAHAYRRHPPILVQFCNAEQVIRRYDDAGIEKGALLPIVSPEVYLPQSNEEILEMAEQHPSRLIPFCNVDPRALTNSADAPLDRLLRYYRDLGCRGLGEVMPNVPVMDPMVQNLFKHAQDVGLPVIFDGSDQVGGDFGLYDDPGLSQLEKPADRNVVFRPRPGQVKRPRPSGQIEEEGAVPRLFRQYPNLYGDLSDWNPWNALARDAAYGPKFLEEFQDRLLFGTDLCSFDTPFRMADLLLNWRANGRISEAAFSKIARENAVKLLGLE